MAEDDTKVLLAVGALGLGGLVAYYLLKEKTPPSPPSDYHTLFISLSGQGSTSPAPGSYSYLEGTDVPILATPAAGWEFSRWLIGSLQIWYPSYTVIMDSDKAAIAYFTQLPPPEEKITEQLASCWPYISGGGTQVGNSVIYALRNGVWLAYDSRFPEESDLKAFVAGDVIALYLTQACTLVYEGRSWVLEPYSKPNFPDWIVNILW